MTKKKLPLRVAIRMGLKGLPAHPWRLLIVVLLTVCALMMFGLTVTAAFYDDETILAESYYDYELSTEIYSVDEENEAFPILQSDLDALYQATGVHFSPAAEADLFSYFRKCFPAFPSTESLSTCLQFFSSDMGSGVCYLSKDALADTDFTLYGRLPQNSGEIAVNSCWTEAFIQFGFYDSYHYPFEEVLINEDFLIYEYVPDERGICKISSAQDLVDLETCIYLPDPETGEDAPLKIVGVVDYAPCLTCENGSTRQGYYDSLYVSEDYMASFMRSEYGAESALGIMAVAAKMPSVKTAKALISFCDESGYALNSSVVRNFTEYSKTLAASKTTFAVAGIAFGIFAALLIYQFVSLSVDEKRDQIGVLRALGAHASDVYKIFFSESVFLAVIDIIIALPVTYFMCGATNYVLLKLFHVSMAFMHFGVAAVVAVILIGLIVTLAATFFPVYRMAKKQPVDCIRECY